jgi:hypothetical protein
VVSTKTFRTKINPRNFRYTFRGLTGISNIKAGSKKLCNKDRVQAPEAIIKAFLPYNMFLEVWTASTVPVTSDLHRIKSVVIYQ